VIKALLSLIHKGDEPAFEREQACL